MIEIHASQVPRILRCPASIQAPEIERTGDSEAARIGSAVHELLAAHVQGKTHDPRAVAKREGLPVDSVSALCAMGRNLWAEYSESLRIVAVEQTMRQPIGPDCELAGRADIIAVAVDDPTCLIVWDWKTGRQMTMAEDQERTYGYLACAEIQDVEIKTVKVCTAWIRDYEVEIVDLSPADLGRIEGRLEKAVAHQDRYGPDAETCRFCPRNLECPARMEIVKSTAAALVVDGEAALPPAPALAGLYPRAKLLASVLEQYDAALKVALEDAGGTLPMGDGRELYLKPAQRKTLDVRGAVKLAEEGGLAFEDIIPALSVASGELRKAVVKTAPARGKTARWKGFLAELAERGGVAVKDYTSVVVRKGD